MNKTTQASQGKGKHNNKAKLCSQTTKCFAEEIVGLLCFVCVCKNVDKACGRGRADEKESKECSMMKTTKTKMESENEEEKQCQF